MIGALVAIALASIAGSLVVERLAQQLPRSSRLAAGFLLGVGIIAGMMLFLSLVGVGWNRWTVVGPLNLMVAMLLWRRLPVMREVSRGAKFSPAAATLLGVTAVSVAGYVLFSTAAPLPEFDFLTDWGLKGKTFWLSRGVDWSFLQEADYRATHSDYPLLLPLTFDFIAVISGAWNDRWFGLLYAGFALAVLILIHDEIRSETESPVFAAFAVFVCSGLALSPWIGLADGPLAAYILAALLSLRRAIERSESLLLAALLLGCAAVTKNEGVTLLVAVAVVLLASRHRRRLVQLWPAFAIAGSWQLLRLLFDLRSDLAETGVMTRLLSTLADPGRLLQALTTYVSGRPLLWIAVAAVGLIALRELRKEWLILSVVSIQLGFYLLAYAVTPHDVAWHVRWSWERLLSHVQPALVLALLAVAGRVLYVKKLDPSVSDAQSSADHAGSF